MEENCQELPGNFLFGLVRKQGNIPRKKNPLIVQIKQKIC